MYVSTSATAGILRTDAHNEMSGRKLSWPQAMGGGGGRGQRL